jgi:hypothetical protein
VKGLRALALSAVLLTGLFVPRSAWADTGVYRDAKAGVEIRLDLPAGRFLVIAPSGACAGSMRSVRSRAYRLSIASGGDGCTVDLILRAGTVTGSVLMPATQYEYRGPYLRTNFTARSWDPAVPDPNKRTPTRHPVRRGRGS